MATDITDNLYYSVEKPHICGGMSLKKFNWTFNTYDRIEVYKFYLDCNRMCILISNFKSDVLKTTKAVINIDISCITMTHTYKIHWYLIEIWSTRVPELI